MGAGRRRAGAALTRPARSPRRPPAAGGRATGAGDLGASRRSSSSALLATLILTSKGWPTVRETFFNWDAFKDVLPRRARRLLARRQALPGRRDRGADARAVVALVRSARAPALFPLRLLAAIYTDVFRGLPTILVIYLIGFGVPALELSGRADRPGRARRASRWRSPTRPTWPRSTARASSRCTRASARRRWRSGSPSAQAMRHVVLPQAVRRVVPPLLNDFISLQKDVALVSILGPLEAFRVAQIAASLEVQLHAAARGRAAVPVRHDPDGADRRPLQRATAGCAGRR